MPCLVFGLVLSMVAAVQAQDLSSVPGVPIFYQPLDYSEDWPWESHVVPREFIADPEIVVLQDGSYLATCDQAGWDSGSDTSGNTRVFRSTNKGASWTYLGVQTGILRGSLFIRGTSDIFLYGAVHDAGANAVLLKSTNNGASWTKYNFGFGGPATPNNPILFNDRWWSSFGTASCSASKTAALTDGGSWSLVGGFPGSQPGWLSEGEFMGEGQIVASPELGVFILPKVKQHALTGLLRVDSTTGAVSFDPNRDFVEFPGGEKKFGAAYDEVSGNFYALSNPILPIDSGTGIEPDMTRNTAALLCSKDLRNWKMKQIFLYSRYEDTEGFGYLNFDFDGNDMAVIARTAFKIPGETFPDRGHDSNVLTFHTIADFRNASPNHVLKLEGGDVVRYEKNQHARDDAPLGRFALGSNFAGAPLLSPNGFGKAADGDVYIRETGGRILRFDAGGNFINTTNASPVAFKTTALSIGQLADSCIWTKSGSGNWSDINNWYYWNRAATDEDIAVFGSAATAPATINLGSLSHEWLFETAGNFEGWTTANLSGAAVSGGTLSGTASSLDPQVYRTDLSFQGSSVSNVTLRMRAPTNNVSVTFYWGNSVNNGFSSARILTKTYTGNGEFQDLVFELAGNAAWDGQVIRRIRFDPLNGPLVKVDIDSITLRKEPTRLKGLRFRNAKPYTLAGGGSLSVGAAGGAGTIDVQQGSHAVGIPVMLNGDTSFNVESGSALTLSAELDINGKTLETTGAGLLVVDNGSLLMNGGAITVGAGSAMYVSNSIVNLGGVVEFKTPQNFNPVVGQSFHIMEGKLRRGMFSQVILPALAEGLGWNTSTLYVDGNVSVALQVPASWMDSYGLPQDGSADFIDSDGDGFDNYSEWKAGTNPTNNLSFFAFDAAGSLPVETGFRLRWNSLTGRTYRVEMDTNLTVNPPFTVLQSGIPGQEGTTEFIDTNAPGKNQSYYRVYVE